MNQEVLSIVQTFLHTFVSNDHFHFFDLYFTMLLEIIAILSKLIAPLSSPNIEANIEVLKQDVSLKINLGFNIFTTMTCSTFELFSIFLNLLQVFPKAEAFDKIRPSTFVSVTSYVEGYLRKLITSFGGGEEQILKSHFFIPSILRMKDLVFLLQEPIRLLIRKHEYRYCYMGLLCQIAISSSDMITHCRELTLQCYSILQNKYYNEADIESIGRFLGPFVQMVFQCWGLIPPETVVQTNIALANHMIRTRKQMNELVFSFLNLVKSHYVFQNDKVGNIYLVSKTLGRNTDITNR